MEFQDRKAQSVVVYEDNLVSVSNVQSQQGYIVSLSNSRIGSSVTHFLYYVFK